MFVIRMLFLSALAAGILPQLFSASATPPIGSVARMVAAMQEAGFCDGYEALCGEAAAVAVTARENALAALARVRADLEADRRARARS